MANSKTRRSARSPKADTAESRSEHLQERTWESLQDLGVPKGASILVAVSGGPDSLALLHTIKSLRDEGHYTIAAAHIDHQLRKESKHDEELVRKYCGDWDIPLHARSVEMRELARARKKGIEETAGIERYRFFEEIAARESIGYVLTAHTANDQAETVILNLIRGAGVRGLAGIPPKRKLGGTFVLRPWLEITREEVLQYIVDNGLTPAVDASNEELTYQRNRIRHQVLPQLAEVYPDRSPFRSLSNLARRMRELSSFLSALTEEKLDALRVDGGLSISGLLNLRGVLLHDLLEAWIEQEYGRYRMTDRESKRVAAFLASDSTSMELRSGLGLLKEDKTLKLDAGNSPFSLEPRTLTAGMSCETSVGCILLEVSSSVKVAKDPNVATFDRDGICTDSLLVRPWQPKDRIAAFGFNGQTKLVSDLLREAGIKGRRKAAWPVVVEQAEGRILWIPGVRAAEHGRVTKATKSTLVLKFQPAR